MMFLPDIFYILMQNKDTKRVIKVKYLVNVIKHIFNSSNYKRMKERSKKEEREKQRGKE